MASAYVFGYAKADDINCSGLDPEAKAICESIKDIDCDDLSGDAKKDCEKKDKEAKNSISILKLNEKTQGILSNQINTINYQQKQNLVSLKETSSRIESLSEQISRLEADITEKEISISQQKKILEGLLQLYYDYDQQGVLDMILLKKDFSGIINQADYTNQSSTKISDILGEIIRIKTGLINNKEELDAKKKENEKTKEKLADVRDDLLTSEKQKQSLLTKTQGEEEKYKKLLERVEAQKLELFGFSDASNLDDIIASVKNYPKPSSNLASTKWYFSQRDSRWGNKTIGNSKSLMKDYGCAITSVSMVFRKYGSTIDPGKMAKQPIFYYDLIKWPASWNPEIALVSSISHGNISWSKVDSEIKKGHPVIIYIKRSRGGGHYVVITGKDKKDYIVHDPYFGANLYLGTSKSLVGKLGKDSSVKIDQMIIYNN